ncbi:MAG: poly-beta-1,6 N-acetyl-D-glucosamine synthase, partial [Nitrospinota bacterium]
NIIFFEGSVLLVLVCLLQFGVGILLDSRYEKKTGRYYYWVIWYPLFDWVLAASSQAISVPKAIFRKKRGFETWESPDRGLNSLD